MHAAIIFNAITDESTPDEKDVMVQVESVSASLRRLGYSHELVPCDLDLTSFRKQLETLKPDVVFNLVESLGGEGRLIHVVPFLLDAMRIPYTGSRSDAVYLSSHKVLAKEKMASANLSTPSWIGPCPLWGASGRTVTNRIKTGPENTWIIKSVWEHASIGLDDASLITVDGVNTVMDHLQQRFLRRGDACFAEQYIEGREFNLSLLAAADGPEVLRPAEILFEGFPEGKPRIVGYSAKWDEGSFEYHHTPRCFDFSSHDSALIEKLEDMAVQCWQLFGLGGYARVDFRVDNHGTPWILEVNTNPCLSPDAGFAAALNRSGMDLNDAVERILEDALRKKACRSDRSTGVTPFGFGSVFPEEISAKSGDFFRYEAAREDITNVRELVTATGFFSEAEVDVAAELVEERLMKGAASGYNFVFVERENRLAGYACFGPIPCTVSSYDLYWIAVHPDFQHKGLGRTILHEAERLIRKAGGTRIYVDTSQRPQYADTRAFYQRCGFATDAVLEDFYDQGDGKMIFSKCLPDPNSDGA